MGWRTDDAYEQMREEEWRKLPLRHRYNWGTIIILGVGAMIVAYLIVR